ncbi:hypothetical protein IMG5_166040 [Ichthyophthirius multifiliis]|uniref:Uncharacterized protein n=1 Tax=Ichthyophthirius multifiliis TaxID=5932 RepID=G0R0P6_ICHMU|nr:hypothetical protein IMG5_166040 [Ichthyophthirius multifiliis]EGR28961.1 hypothetical protein IMG5_166040 [Ichthyophthirius multifiliis]|eukprot:XP_004030197.1 hypothetical protein IMG5_166040 [Ichthyophthirius multifiliis]
MRNIYLNQQKKDIEVYKLGKNLQHPPGFDYTSKKHPYSCSGKCDGSEKFTRYICINCLPGPYQSIGFIEFNKECYDKYMNGDEELTNHIANTQDSKAHTKEHMILKLIAPYGSYREF